MKTTFAGLALVFGMLLPATTPASAQTITPQEFKRLCERPGNLVTLTAPLKVSSPVDPAPIVRVASRCTVALGPDTAFEADVVNLRFSGPLVFQSSAKAAVLLTKALLTAPRLTVDLTGNEGTLLVNESRLNATAGNLEIQLGDFGVLDVTAPFGGSGNALQAAGTLLVSGGVKFAGVFNTTRVRGGTGITVSLDGPEASLSSSATSFQAVAGTFSLTSPGDKATFDKALGQITAPGGIAVTFTGAESAILISGSRATAVSGPIALAAGGGDRSFGIVTVSDATLRAGGAVSLLASVAASKGEAVIGATLVNAGGDILVASGEEGLSSVLGNTLTSATRIAAVTGPSGTCVAESNRLSAPLLRLCQ